VMEGERVHGHEIRRLGRLGPVVERRQGQVFDVGVHRSADARPGAQSKAYAIKGVIACRKFRDPEMAGAVLRQMGRAPVQRLRIIKACKDVGVALDQR